jgi:hypothetical protein
MKDVFHLYVQKYYSVIWLSFKFKVNFVWTYSDFFHISFFLFSNWLNFVSHQIIIKIRITNASHSQSTATYLSLLPFSNPISARRSLQRKCTCEDGRNGFLDKGKIPTARWRWTRSHTFRCRNTCTQVSTLTPSYRGCVLTLIKICFFLLSKLASFIQILTEIMRLFSQNADPVFLTA